MILILLGSTKRGGFLFFRSKTKYKDSSPPERRNRGCVTLPLWHPHFGFRVLRVSIILSMSSSP